ncbi:MAG: response regulator [Candidatus Aminicenantes bacterium]|nr:response regulator [Candidatus Aminicenantes bacterium]
MKYDISLEDEFKEKSRQELLAEIAKLRGKIDSIKDTPAAAPPKTGSPKILIAEDELMNQVLLVEHFKCQGLNSILTANNGLEAVDLALEHNPDLILMDIQMPKLDGIGAIIELRKQGYKRPIIALTAYAMKSDKEKSQAAGADDHFSKPIDFDTFFPRIQKYLQADIINASAVETNKIGASVSQKIKQIFLNTARERLSLIKAILAGNGAALQGIEIKRIAHSYKGNAAHLGLKELESTAKKLDAELRNNEPGEAIRDSLEKLAGQLREILQANPI